MCGIAGQIQIDSGIGKAPLHELPLRLALKKIEHRGPDNSDLKNFGSCIIGHNRLKILDLSSAANQPMSDESGRYWIVFNGEIFNYRELKSRLEKNGTQFHSKSDTEVLLHLLIRFGEEILNELNGFFSFAFYDREKKELILVRDRFGEKPLWYGQKNETLSFASELKALLCLDVEQEIDPVSLSLFLQFTYIPAPHSILKGVYKLEPGHILRVSNGAVSNTRWYLPEKKKNTENSSHAIVNEFKYLMNDAVELRTHADVPVGCFLSGGIDSSIVALLASKSQSHISTFSIGFSDQPFLDETKYAVEVAKHIGSQHEVIQIPSESLLDQVSSIWTSMDEPFSDSSSIAVSMLSRIVKSKVTVALSGDGADEIFGGYNKHTALWRSQQRGFLNSSLPLFLPLLNALPTSRHSQFGNKIRQLHRYTQGLEYSLKDRYLKWSSWADESICDSLMQQEVQVRRGARLNAFVQDIINDDFTTLLLADQNLVLSNDMLTKVDTMSMMHSLEVRSPFMDHRIIEFANALPADYKLKKNERKILLRMAYQNELPQSVFNRSKKGFEVPMTKWLRNELKPLVMDTLSQRDLASKAFLKGDIIQNVLDHFYKKGNIKHTSLIYSLLVFEIWYKQFLQTTQSK